MKTTPPKGQHLLLSYGIYHHHAISFGDGSSVQYGGGDLRTNRVEIVSLDSLPVEKSIHVIESQAKFGPDEIIQRALSRLGENQYCLATNNCEHFANWCRCGRSVSRQVDRVVQRTASATVKLTTRSRVKALAQYGSKFLSKRLAKSATPWLIVADVAQLGVEVAVSGRGTQPHQAQRVGQATGLGASIGIGAVTAGPVGAIAGASIWAVGEVVGKMAADRSVEIVVLNIRC